MIVTDWIGFAGAVAVLLGLLLLLARASQGMFRGTNTRERDPEGHAMESERSNPLTEWDWGAGEEIGRKTPPGPQVGSSAVETAETLGEGPSLSTRLLLANVLFSHGLFALLVLAAGWYFAVPIRALGVTAASANSEAVAIGLALGTGLYAVNEFGSFVGRRVGIGGNEALRQALAPESRWEWVLLLGVVLPLIAGFEELLFRGVLVGALATGFAVSPWLLAVGSSVAFALGHGAQGRAGIVVTGLLGFGLAVAFVLTESLVVVIIAHYLVNALEFLVHEWFGWEPN